MTTDRIEKPLPPSLMKAITAVMRDTEMTIDEKFEAVVLMAHGYGLWCDAPTVEPTKYAIPEEQWKGICQMFVDATRGLPSVDLALQWMNFGPSSYEAVSGG